MNNEPTKERPILFSAPMVRAILDGTKTQTRRVLKMQPRGRADIGMLGAGIPFIRNPDPKRRNLRCPYGQPGDRLYVRETWGVGSRPCPSGGYDGIEYRADVAWTEDDDLLPCNKVETPDGVCLGDYRSGWKPSIHMPRWASRIDLEITGVRVERLNAISEADAQAEGSPCYVCGGPMDGRSEKDCHCFHAKAKPSDFRALWESINGAGSWDANPWVWVVEFRRL